MAGELQTEGLSNALVILGAAGVVIPAFARVRINPIVGFLLVGLLVGPFGLGSLADSFPWLRWITISDIEEISPLGDYGIILLLFTIGLELSFRRLWKMRRTVFGLGPAQLFGGGLLIAFGLSFLDYSAASAVGLGLALALSSTALVVPIAGTQSAVGQRALGMLLFEDLAIVPIIFFLGALAPKAASGSFDGLVTVIMEGALVVGIMLVLGRFLLPYLFGQAARTKSPELFLAASLLVVIIASLATSAVGLSPIFGALIAGLLIAETDYRHEVEVITAPFKGLALGVFLITIGMQIDLNFIRQNWTLLVAAVSGIIIVKSLVTGGLLKIAGARTGTATETGLLMSSPSETTLIVLAAASAAQLIDPDTATFWQATTAIGLTITPILARIGHDMAKRIELRESEPLRLVTVPDGERAIIVGFGRVGMLIADMLSKHDQPYIAVEANVDAVTSARRRGYDVMFGDVSRHEVLERIDIAKAKALILTMDEPVLTARIVKRIRSEFPDLTIISRARDADHAAELYRAGVTDAVPETLESSLQLSEAVLVDLGIPMGFVIASIHEKRDEFRRIIMEQGGLDEAPKLKLRTTERS
ncbi:sodium:proton exchanger [Sphingorhabdus sp. IMCC26285]|jgi:CPA2 family monovalent cation:H+ antiporter-2|uniref:Sodium:proton exchanger n=1 Tax=Sphingorhabdus profundilacus TaxID=2509718 RepID=A0A6I4LUT2_9SPHN|nr:cation:proton antiporter [Sphingorhabdus profundilacus]MVZ97257.1 sodium:proton exchanger [Sphingorhabdus profundilacus]